MMSSKELSAPAPDHPRSPRLPAVALGTLSVAILGLAVAGCAAMFSSGPTALHFQSNPTGAQVLVNGVPRGTTPVTLPLHADDEHIVTFRRTGCTDVTLPLETHVQAGFVVLDLLAGIIGVAVDAGTGEWKEFNDRVPYAQLDCRGALAAGPEAIAVPPSPDPEPSPAQRGARPEEPEAGAEQAGDRPATSAATAFPGGRWSGTLRPGSEDWFEAAITLNELPPGSRGGAVAGLATYRRGQSVCVYRLTVESRGAARLVLSQTLETPSPRCAQGLRLVLEPVAGSVLSASLEQPDGRTWASGLLEPAGCETIRGAWRPANCPGS